MKNILVVVLMIVSVVILVACSNGGSSSNAIGTLEPVPAEYAGKTNPLGSDAAMDGAKVFKVNCSACHGEQGHGDGPAGATLDPAPKNLAELQTVAADDYLYWRINTGKPGTSMIPWQGVLTDDQIWQVVSFIRTLK